MAGGATLEKVVRQDLWTRGRSQPPKGVCVAVCANVCMCEHGCM